MHAFPGLRLRRQVPGQRPALSPVREQRVLGSPRPLARVGVSPTPVLPCPEWDWSLWSRPGGSRLFLLLWSPSGRLSLPCLGSWLPALLGCWRAAQPGLLLLRVGPLPPRPPAGLCSPWFPSVSFYSVVMFLHNIVSEMEITCLVKLMLFCYTCVKYSL